MAMPIDRGDALHPREQQVLQFLAEGHGLKEIAHQLGIAYTTTKVYTQCLKLKLGARTLPHAVMIGIRQGIVA
jgi:DNA-binding NarL/FixJ family response regulator